MHKTTDNGVIKINDLSFMEFCNRFRGFQIVNKSNGAMVPKFLLFWSGLTFKQVEKKYDLIRRT